MGTTVTVTFPRDVWTAGEALPFEIHLVAGGRKWAPRWHVWARPVGGLEYYDLAYKDGHVQVPIDAAELIELLVRHLDGGVEAKNERRESAGGCNEAERWPASQTE